MLKTRLGARRARFWRGSGLSWATLERELAGFWAPLGSPGSLLGASWTVLGHFFGAPGRSGGLLGLILVPRNAPSLDFGGVRDVLGKVLESSRGMFWHAFFCASHFVT